jgi:hypothetical protein
MCHKLQPSSVKSDGLNSVVRAKTDRSTSRIPSNDAGSERENFPAQHRSEIASTENPQVLETGESQSFAVANSSGESKDSIGSTQTPGRGRPGPRGQQLRCDVARSVGYDPTGEHAVACGALVQVVCEYCGPMCASCAEETFCFYGEHKLTQLPDDGPLPASQTRRRPVNEVVYVELKCPNCNRVRLALPKKHQPKRVRKCPVCKAKAPAEYLAHGFTRRRLPYHEVFTTQADPNELTILPNGTRRLPWDTRHWADYKE